MEKFLNSISVEILENIAVSGKHYIVIKETTNDKNGTIIFHNILWNPEIQKVFTWIKEKLVNYSINTKEIPHVNTQLVRLRIATNMIFKLNLSIEDKQGISYLINKMYWELHKILNEWYMQNVLPF